MALTNPVILNVNIKNTVPYGLGFVLFEKNEEGELILPPGIAVYGLGGKNIPLGTENDYTYVSISKALADSKLFVKNIFYIIEKAIDREIQVYNPGLIKCTDSFYEDGKPFIMPPLPVCAGTWRFIFEKPIKPTHSFSFEHCLNKEFQLAFELVKL